jgi:oligopeptide/dipeptide ABC transporter ATP-binding protein
VELFFEIKDVHVQFDTSKEIVKALNGFSLNVYRGDLIGIVGESGSGKSVAVSSVINLLRPPGRIVSGDVLYKGKSVYNMSKVELERFRGGVISVIPAGARSMLHPMLAVGRQIANVYQAHNPQVSAKEAMEKVVEILELVQIPDPHRRIKALPGEFSGGMAQRVLIAMALVNTPELVIADDATTGLDVTVQAQVLDLIQDRVKKLGSAAILFTHDLGIVAQYCRKVGIMFAGRIIEYCDSVDGLLRAAAHPYTRTLLSGTPGVPIPYEPEVNAAATSRQAISEKGCLAQERCLRCQPVCRAETPDFKEIMPGHFAQCHFAGRDGAI